MKALVIGYGSMGRRRIRILSGIMSDVDFVCVDSNPSRIEQIQRAGLRPYERLEDALEERPDIAFVCTPPGDHAELILRLLEHGIHVFTELNLADTQYDLIIDQARKAGSVIFMSGTMLYDKRIAAIDAAVRKQTKPLTYLYHVGQYLPDWHPWERYQDFFASRRDTSGVRELYAVQLPWIINAFGPIDSVKAVSRKCSSLDIDYPDSVIAVFEHNGGTIGVFTVDVLSRKATTRLEVLGEDMHIIWDGHNDDLRAFDVKTNCMRPILAYESTEHRDEYSDNIIEDRYRDEIQDFLDVVYRGAEPRYSLRQDQYVLKIIDTIEGLMQ